VNGTQQADLALDVFGVNLVRDRMVSPFAGSTARARRLWIPGSVTRLRRQSWVRARSAGNQRHLDGAVAGFDEVEPVLEPLEGKLMGADLVHRQRA
jgi:hypothetical protein